MGNVINAQLLFNRIRMWMAGVSFNGRRDLYELFGYKRVINFLDYTALYYRNSLAKRIVDQPVSATWSDPPQLQADNPEFMTAWEKIVEEQALWHNIMRLDKLAGLGRFAVMVVGFDDGQDLGRPVKPGSQVIYMQPYHEGAISILGWDIDLASPRYGKPVLYNINPGRYLIDGLQTTMTAGLNVAQLRKPFNVHYSRIIHVAENMLEDGVFGSSRLEAVYNDVCDVMKVTGGSAELFWTLANRGMQIDVDKEVDLSPEDAEELQREVEDYQHDIRRFIRTRGTTIKDLGSHVADPTGVMNTLIRSLSSGCGIPQQIFTGSSAGQIASHQDRANYADRIAERVAEYASPIVLKRTLDCFINAGSVPQPINLVITWPEAFKLNPLERAQTSAQMARSAVNLTKARVQAITATVGSGDNEKPLGEPPLFDADEMRRIVSFGRHPPVFDNPAPTGNIPIMSQDPSKEVDDTEDETGQQGNS